jgi:hypothetical protein
MKNRKRLKITEMTRTDFLKLPHRHDWGKEFICRSLVILPMGRLHDSGYRCIDFVAVDKENEPICRLSGCSDVIHFDGIGGYGYNWINKAQGVPRLVEPSAWNIDCLKKSGLLRIFPSSGSIICGDALSSFEIWKKKEEDKNE